MITTSIQDLIQTESTGALQAEPTQAEATLTKIEELATPVSKTENINGQDIRVGALEQFAKEVLGRELKKLPRLASGKVAGITLGVEKFNTSAGKFYRLIWIAVGRDVAWLAAEDDMRYCCKGNAVIAGYEIGDELKVFFNETTR